MARREKGEGSISQRKDGIWTARIDLGRDQNGKRKIKALYGKTEKEVKKKLKEYKIELIKHELEQVKKITVQEYMSDWLKTIKKNELKSSSYDRLEVTCENQIFPHIGYLQMNSVKADDIQKLINHLNDSGYSYSTIKKAYNAINACFTFAYEREEIPKNPIVRISLPRQKEKEISDIVFFNESEIELIEKYALEKYKTGKYKYKNGYAIILLLHTGLRIGELLGLKWNNIDFENKILKVSGNLKQVKNRDENKGEAKYIVIEQTTKTKSGNRIIPLSDKAIEALKYFEKRKLKKDSYVLITKNGKSVSARNIDTTFRQILKNAGIDKISGVHSLRHTFASMLFKKGVDPKTVSELLRA